MTKFGEMRVLGSRFVGIGAAKSPLGFRCSRDKGLRFITVVLALSLLSSGALSAGCSSTKRTVRTETCVLEDEDGYMLEDERRPGRRVVERTETEEESDGGSCGGVLSCTVDGVGWVLALPFRLVGGIIGFIF